MSKESTYDEILKEIKTLKIEFQELSKKIDLVNDSLTSIKESNDSIKQSSTKMVNHIDFVENVYDRIKKPFNFLMNKVSTTVLLDDKVV